MEVISSRSNCSVRSTSRPQRKGLSLTSRGKCNSLPKPYKYSSSQETMQTAMFSQTQTTIKFQNPQQKLAWLNPSSNQAQHSISVAKTLSQMPKITFRYTNQTKNTIQTSNVFFGQFNSLISPANNRGRDITSQQLRQVVISKSMQTKHLSQSKINPQSRINEANSNRQLIDSRKIDRQIFEQKVYSVLPSIGQTYSDLHAAPVKRQIISEQINQNLIFTNVQHEIINKSRLIEQNLSPYHLLVSSAKKCQSKEGSPMIKQQGSLQLISLERIPQVQQFNAHLNDQDSEISIDDHHIVEQRVSNQIQTSDNQAHQNQLFKIKVTSPEQNQRITVSIAQSVQQKALSNKVFNFVEIQNKNGQQKSPSKSPSKKQKDKIQDYVLSQIENRPPQIQHSGTVSGRRNFRRIKQIQKRLEQIISICNHNL